MESLGHTAFEAYAMVLKPFANARSLREIIQATILSNQKEGKSAEGQA